MTRLEALKTLLEKVEAGEWFPGLAQLSFGGVQNYHNAREAYNGSLDAAKALHEAVLPGWFASSGTWGACVSDPETHVSDSYACDGEGISYARAWLIAIIKALIANEER